MHSPQPKPIPDTPFVNEVRLNTRHWMWAGAVVLLVALLPPPLWERIERFDTGSDYRLPYALSKDYWLYARWLCRAREPAQIFVLGDSVVWGEYVLPDGTLSHFLNQEAGQADRFLNGGVNGLFPLAMEGLIQHYGQALHNRKILLHCNTLWLSSPKADLQVDKEQNFNHARLVPQFFPRIPCYRADANERLSAVAERQVSFLAWASHLQNAYFSQQSALRWTLADDGGEPPRYPNSYRNPLAQITLRVPSAPKEDQERGPGSPRHKPWNQTGHGATQFEWVSLDTSLQWAAFQRMVRRLRAEGNDLLVLLGPFNEHQVAEEDRPAFRRVREGIAAWLVANQVPVVAPDPLPSALYADASHPLTEGYAQLARGLFQHPTFQQWLNGGR